MLADIKKIEHLIEDYERDLMGNVYTFELSDGETISFGIKPKDVPHLMGIRKLPLRQVQNKSALAVYDMLKDGRINITHVEPHKEEYKKVMNFDRIVSILHCGEAVRIVKRVGRLHSSYFIYLDHRPDEIVHLGVMKDENGVWHPESLLINKHRDVTAYIDNQIPVDILSMEVTREITMDGNEAYII